MEPMQGDVLARVTRNGMVESVHTGHLIELDKDGSVLRSIGSVHIPIYPRSSVKSLQAAAMVRLGLKLTAKQLALVCASHSGSTEHFDVVRSILASAGKDESAFRNARDLPLGEKEKRAWGDQEPSQIAQNCSGKHAGMIATCVINGWPTDNYTDASHPLQIAIKDEIEKLAREKVQFTTSDGCGAPLFAFSIAGLAQAIHTMTISDDPIYQEVMNAQREFPEMVGGIGRLNTRQMQAVDGLFMKDGAEGVMVASVRDGRTLAMKVADGSMRPIGPVVHATLKKWGFNSPDETINVLGGGKVVGSVEPA
jgi:L-asparaginase II